MDTAMVNMKVEKVDTYVLHRQSTVAQYIATFPILELCIVAKQWPGASV